MNLSMFFGSNAPYTRQELYELWFTFRKDPNAAKILSDFMGRDKNTARKLIQQFKASAEMKEGAEI